MQPKDQNQTPDSPTIEQGRWYPEMPPALPGESDDAYTNRLTGADGTNRQPYDHHRNRQCSIGWHEECSDPAGERCKCPCHARPSFSALMTWDNPLAERRDTDLDEDGCDCPQDDGHHEWWCTR